MSCSGYECKWEGGVIQWEDLDSIKGVIAYLKELDKERARRFGLPILYRPSLRDMMKTS